MIVSTGAIIERLNVLVDHSSGDLPGSVGAFPNPLLLQAAPKGFGHYIILTVAAPTHAGFQVRCPAETLPRIAVELGALIGVNQDVLGLALTHGHEKCASSLVDQPTMQLE